MPDRNCRLRGFHLASGLLIGLYLLIHMANHLAMFAGQDAHIALMESLRPIYRNAVIEPLLLTAFLFQAGSGLAMIWRTRKTRRGFVPWVQAGSGILVAAFVLNHVAAVLIGRFSDGLDTNFHFAIAGFHAGWAAIMAPYYFLGVAGLFVHIACALSWRLRTNAIPVGMVLAGLALAVGFVAAMAADQPVPVRYIEPFG